MPTLTLTRWLLSLLLACLALVAINVPLAKPPACASRTATLINCSGSIQACIDAALVGDTILIAAGHYTESLTLSKPVSLTGENRDTTIIHAVAGQRVLTVTGASIGTSVVISGLTFTGGNDFAVAPCPTPTPMPVNALNNRMRAPSIDCAVGRGGGILFIAEAHPQLENVIISNNSVNTLGGGIYADTGSSLVLINTSIVSNSATSNQGGGLYTRATLTLIRSQFNRNTAYFGGGIYAMGNVIITASQFLSNAGGGLWAQSTSVISDADFIANSDRDGLVTNGATVITHSRFLYNLDGGLYAYGQLSMFDSDVTGNTNLYDGAGIYAASSATIIDSRIFSNTAGGRGLGGGLHAQSTLYLRDTDFGGNSTGGMGGGVFAWKPVTVIGGRFEQNYAGKSGGGLATYVLGSLTVTGTQFLHNTTSGNGSAIYCEGENQYTLVNAVFAYNTATALKFNACGAALLHNTFVNSTLVGKVAIDATNSTVKITDTIITSHTVAISNSDGTVYEDYNLFFVNVTNTIGSITSGGHSLIGNPNFVDPVNGDYHLRFPSPAIDHGIDVGVYTDLDGNSRPYGAGFDIGAYEFQGSPVQDFALTLAYAGSGNGAVTIMPPSLLYPAGTLITLTATSPISSTFAGWSGDVVTTTNPVTLTMDADKTVTATFTLRTFVITPTASMGGSITPSILQTVNYGDDITFTIAADTGYHIANVAADGMSQGAVNAYIFNHVTADHILTATFALNPPVGLSAINNGPTAFGNVTTLTATVMSGLDVVYAWNFGDGNLGAGATVTHTYMAAGTYTAVVTATNSAGYLTATTTVYVTSAPIAIAGPNQTVRTRGLVTLNGGASFDPGNFLPLTYHWQQTGGQAATLAGANNMTATFTAPAVTQTQALTFALTVTNSQGIASLPDVVVIAVQPYRIMLPLVLK
jgi:predicted outer membrane repeat protein